MSWRLEGENFSIALSMCNFDNVHRYLEPNFFIAGFLARNEFVKNTSVFNPDFWTKNQCQKQTNHEFDGYRKISNKTRHQSDSGRQENYIAIRDTVCVKTFN